MTEERMNYIDGEWRGAESGDRYEVTNPADTTEVVATFPRASTEDAENAIEAAKRATDQWASMPGPERGSILRDAAGLLEARKDEVTEALTREEGKTTAEAAPEVQRAIDILYYYAEQAAEFGGNIKQASGQNKTLHTVREPMGVAGLITPWNYPIAIPTWKLAPALATGNTVVLKPAMQAPTVAAMVVECLDEAGIPDGVINLVTGPGREVGETLTTHGDVDAVSFTGSAAVGEHVYQAATDDRKRVQAEMGGKNPAIVTSSADVDEAVDIVGAGALGVTGQACTATSRAIVHEDNYDEFVEGIVEYAADIEVGNGLDGADMGPQANQTEFEGTLEYVDIAVGEGADLRYGGEALDGDAYENGYFLQPTVFADVDPEMRIACEEVFGPVLAVIEVSDFEEAMAVANDSQYGLSASVVTDDLSEAHSFVAEIEAGVAKVNEKTTGLELHAPFGGVKDSSTNTYREQGEAGIEFYTTTKTVYLNY